MFIMGTAGHIDHGKTTLITKLTGINPDRLQEEQARGMTVDLGFAWLTLPQGTVGIVDVPGHHRLVKNMLAGVGHLDLVLLVIAADDGWMPQTQEHVDILHLLGVRHGVIALTKADLVEPEWLELVEADIEEHLINTNLEHFPIVPVSAVTGYNIDLLKTVINSIIQTMESKPDLHDPLLWIDRVFTIKGAGTIVTGTLTGGTLAVGSEVMVQPPGLEARIRGLQTHTQAVETGVPGSRLAVNLTGVEKDELERGMYLCLPGKRPFYSVINALAYTLPNSSTSIQTDHTIKVYVGTQETLGRVKILEGDSIEPGNEGLIQLELETPVHLRFRDPFIMRHSELQDTLGGGLFLEEGIPVRGQNLRLVGPRRLEHLFPFEDPNAHLDLSLLRRKGQADSKEMSHLLAQDRPYWHQTDFVNHGGTLTPELLQFDEFIMAPEQFQKLKQFLEQTVQQYHEENPLSLGPNKETIRVLTGLPTRLFDAVLNQLPTLREERGSILWKDHRIQLTKEEQARLTQLRELINTENPYEPISLSVLVEKGYSKEFIYGIAHLGHIILLPTEQITTPEILNQIKNIILSEDIFQDGFGLGVFRDRLGTSRRHALAFLEYFDAAGFTIRKGDVRSINKRPQS